MSDHSDAQNRFFSLYFDSVPENVNKIDTSHGDGDFRNVYICDDGQKKLVIKVTSNQFTDTQRIECWARLIKEYNKLGIYCPNIIPNRHGELSYHYTENGRDFYVYAEEFAAFETAEKYWADIRRGENGKPVLIDDMLRSVAKIAEKHFDFMPFYSGYCILDPWLPDDKTDEITESALYFHEVVKSELPKYEKRADRLLELFYENQKALREIYYTLPTSCFQADMNETNILIDENHNFAGVIDFNFSGKEPTLSYTVREALWNIYDNRLFNENDTSVELCWYDRRLNDVRTEVLMKNLKVIEEFYHYSDAEREAFPKLLRYVDTFWWHHVDEIKRISGDDEKLNLFFDWMENQLTRDDIRLP